MHKDHLLPSVNNLSQDQPQSFPAHRLEFRTVAFHSLMPLWLQTSHRKPQPTSIRSWYHNSMPTFHHLPSFLHSRYPTCQALGCSRLSLGQHLLISVAFLVRPRPLLLGPTSLQRAVKTLYRTMSPAMPVKVTTPANLRKHHHHKNTGIKAIFLLLCHQIIRNICRCWVTIPLCLGV